MSRPIAAAGLATRARVPLPAALAALLVLFSGSPAHALVLGVLVSTTGDATLGGLNFEAEDLALYDPATNVATLYFDGDAEFPQEEDIDAVFLRANGNIILSTAGDAQLGSLAFEPEDLVEYNPVTNAATLFFDGDAEFPQEEDIEGVWVFGNGSILLSTVGDATLGGLVNFEPEDLVLYDPVTNVASLYFDGDAEFTLAEEDIDAFSFLNGRLILSTASAASLGGLSFQPDDLVLYDPVTNVASLFMNGDLEFAQTNENIDALFIPEPGTAALLTVGLAGFVVSGRRRK